MNTKLPVENGLSDVPAAPAPVKKSERIVSLDILRGFAVLGILVMNIQSFSMPDPTYFNPTVYGDFTGINYYIWLGSHLFTELKFMTIFSMLFGAGIVLLCSRLEGRGQKPARIHYRRIFWLLIFGLMHAYLLWNGDILVWYSLSAFIAYLFWRVRPGWLIFWSLLLLMIGTGIYLFFQWSMPYWPEEALENNMMYWNPSSQLITERLQAYRGGWLEQMPERTISSLMLHTVVYLIYGLWRTLGMMLAGMALMKWGIFSAERSKRFYTAALIGGLLVGISVTAYGAYQNALHEWSFEYSMYIGTLYLYWGSIPTALAYISAIMLVCRSGAFSRVKDRLAEIGRMAFSCYILQTIICTAIFFGHGFGLYGMVPRWGQILIVPGVWIILFVFAYLWLKQFRFGPLEWLWRSLTYRKRRPMRIPR